jgi:hypothetical protein
MPRPRKLFCGRVPARPLTEVPDPERAGQVDHAHAFLHEGRRQLGGGILRHGEKREVRFTGQTLRVQRFHLAIPQPGQAGQRPGG